MINLALNKPALQSSVSEWSNQPDPAQDARGGNNGKITREYGFHTAIERTPWWQVDLLEDFLIRKVVLFNRHQCAERLRYFSVLMSRDGETWEQVFRKTDDSLFGAANDLPYVIEPAGARVARYVRIRVDDVQPLHFAECEVYGERLDAETLARMVAEAAERRRVPDGRQGELVELEGFLVFVDTANYDPTIIRSLKSGTYEASERRLTRGFVRPTDRVIEIGTAIGAVTMTAASIVGAENVLTFDANPDIVADAQANFRRNWLGGIRARTGLLKPRHAITVLGEFVDFFIASSFWASRLNASEHDHDIVGRVTVPVFCLEDEIEQHDANVLICDIEGGEVDLFGAADLRPIHTIILETHYWSAGEAATDAMVRKLYKDGFALHLGCSANHVSIFRRHALPGP